MSSHIFRLFQLHDLPLRFLGSPFLRAALDSRLGEDLRIMRDAPFPKPAAQIVLDDPVDLEIRISPDGGSKVGIILCRQAEMSRILCGIPRLLHGAQGKTADQSLLRRAVRFPEELLDLLGLHFIPHMDVIAEIIDKRRKLTHLLLVGRIMRPIKKGYIPPEVFLGNRLIRHEHKILYDLSGCISLVGPDLQRLPVLV